MPAPWRGIALASLLTFACINESERTPEVACDNVGFAIASRTLACTGDAKLANARFEAFRSTIACTSPDNLDERFDCAAAVDHLICADVLAFGDDFRRWITDPSCAPLFGVVTDGGTP